MSEITVHVNSEHVSALASWPASHQPAERGRGIRGRAVLRFPLKIAMGLDTRRIFDLLGEREWNHIFTRGYLNGQESIPDGYSGYGNVPCLPVPVTRWGNPTI